MNFFQDTHQGKAFGEHRVQTSVPREYLSKSQEPCHFGMSFNPGVWDDDAFYSVARVVGNMYLLILGKSSLPAHAASADGKYRPLFIESVGIGNADSSSSRKYSQIALYQTLQQDKFAQILNALHPRRIDNLHSIIHFEENWRKITTRVNLNQQEMYYWGFDSILPTGGGSYELVLKLMFRDQLFWIRIGTKRETMVLASDHQYLHTDFLQPTQRFKYIDIWNDHAELGFDHAALDRSETPSSSRNPSQQNITPYPFENCGGVTHFPSPTHPDPWTQIFPSVSKYFPLSRK